ncbi:MAG TPA: RidA family protein [Armatimonadota bacterium]|nr:RidA family protein [Armatimonadota bacterium]
MSLRIEPVILSDLPPAPLPFSPAVKAGGFVFVSGQASVDDEGTIVPDSFEGEFRRSMENVRRILAAAGSDLGHVVQVRGYVRDPANIGLYNRLYREYFKEPYPARSTLTRCLPDTIQFEIDCVAVVNQP